MTRLRISILSAGVMGAIAIPALAQTGPTRVRLSNTEAALPTQSLELRSPTRVRPISSAYESPGSGATPEIISRAGEILGAISNPDRRSELAEQWLQYSRQVIAKEQEFRDQWLDVQRRQLAQQDQTQQFQLEMAQLQMKIEELRAENLRLQQQNLQTQRQLSAHSSR
jgi:hypothetical protein